MRRRQFLSAGAGAGALLPRGLRGAAAVMPQQIHPGVWRFRFGTPERITPVSARRYPPAAAGFAALPAAGSCPVTVSGRATARGFLLALPLAPDEEVYGFGLQLQSFQQRGKKKKLRVNADPRLDTGDTHAPVPFYCTTRGYGVLVDTARYANVYCGNQRPKGAGGERRSRAGEPGQVLVEVPRAAGADVYVFAGPSMRQAVQRYNLFSGGGPLPPRWGLGVWYRCEKDFSQQEVLALAAEFRQRRIPCEVIGLEPGWQTHSYSCSFVWSDKFPDPAAMIRRLAEQAFQLNLWEHAFTHPSSPIHAALLPHSGDYEVWGGLVPDFLDPEARRIFAAFHDQEHVSLGVAGYKLDECDNSDFTGNWSFPELSAFPSGADGEQMHSLFGQRYQDTIQGIFERHGRRSYGLVRSSGALAAPYPYALYSDLYYHTEFLRGVCNAGFSGLLWTPELRDARSPEDLLRRLESVVLSPLALINAWYIKNPPWKQIDRQRNNAGDLDPDWPQLEAQCRAILELRMRLVPYLHAAFVRYRREGLPPFRALVLDYPEDPRTRTIDNQWLAGEGLLVAPLVAGQAERPVYLPDGEWFDFWTGRRQAGKQTITVSAPAGRIPLFVKGGTLLPLADPAAAGKLTVQVYGDGAATLYEEDGALDPSLTEVRLTWADGRGRLERRGPARSPHYTVEWKTSISAAAPVEI